jgi:hypothetical protein
MPSDSWDFDPDEDLPDDPYRGVRRSSERRRRMPILIAGIAAVIIGAGIVYFGPAGGGRNQSAPPGFDSWPNAGAFDPDASASSAPGSGPAASARPSPLVPAQGDTAATQTGKGATHPTVPPFTTLVYEAEAGMPAVKLRSAQVVSQSDASGGKVVQFEDEDGEIQFRLIQVPSAGTYRFAIYYVPGSDTRVGHFSVANGPAVDVTFAAGSGCCSVATIDTALQPGTYMATLSLSAGGGPAIDKMVISRL